MSLNIELVSVEHCEPMQESRKLVKKLEAIGAAWLHTKAGAVWLRSRARNAPSRTATADKVKVIAAIVKMRMEMERDSR